MALKLLDGLEDFGLKFINRFNTLTATVNNLAAGTPPGTYTPGNGIDINGSNIISISGAEQYVNLLANADFSVADAGTSFPAITSGAYFCDVWKYSKIGAMVHTASRSSNSPTITQAGKKITYSANVDCTTIDSSIAAGDYCVIIGYMEGKDFANIAGGNFYMSFWHKHTVAGTHCAVFRNSGLDRSFITEYTQSVSNTWEKSTVLVTTPPETGTWDYSTLTGLSVSFVLANGTTYQNTANTWHTGNYQSTSNQVNNCSSSANDFRIADVRFSNSDVITGVQNQQQILDHVQKYLFISPTNLKWMGTRRASAATRRYHYENFPVRMRAAPTIINGVWTPSSMTISTSPAGVQFETPATSADGDIESITSFHASARLT